MSPDNIKIVPKLAKTGRAADYVVHTLEARIQSGVLSAGSVLPSERELMLEFDISRTVVREAIVALSNKGLVDTRPRFRPVVKKPSFDSAIDVMGSIVTNLLGQSGGVKNLFETRIMIEASLVRQAANEATKNDIANLREALSANFEVIDDSDEFYETDVRFHGVLYKIPHNPVLPALHTAYTNWLSAHWKQMPRSPKRNAKAYAAHAEIFDAIRNRDPDEAEKRLREHLNLSWLDVRETFGDI